MLKPEEPEVRWKRTMAAERARGVYTLDRVASEYMDISALGRTANPEYTPWFIVFGAGRKSYLASLDRYFDPSTRKAFNQELASDELMDGFDRLRSPGPNLLVIPLISAFERAEVAFKRSADSAMVVDTALACMSYRAKNGRDPARLDDLVPDFCPALPTDAFKHQPFMLHVTTEPFSYDEKRRLKVPTGSLIVFSVGEKGIGKPEMLYESMRDDGYFDASNFVRCHFVILPPKLQAK